MVQSKKKQTQSKNRSRATSAKNKNQSISLSFGKNPFTLFVILFAAVGTYLVLQTFANTSSNAPVKPFITDRARGLSWAGIAQDTGDCVKAYKLIDSHGRPVGCTHGPDPAPEGINATQSVEPLSTGDTAAATSPSGIVCDSDGVSGNRVQALYVHASDVTDRYASFATSFQQYAANANTIYSESAAQTGGVRNIRFVTDASCNVEVTNVTVSPTGDDTISNTISELQSQGYTRTDRKYLLWVDSNIYCGIGTVKGDDQNGSANANNVGPSYGRTDSGCWGGNTEAHELMHNLGGVQLSAPNATNGWHCKDEYDRMCYNDGGVTMTYPCAPAEDQHFDCNKDDYFNTNPLAGSYLASHWNVANSVFLVGGAYLAGPSVKITSPANDITVGRKVTITATASAGSSAVQSLTVVIDGKQVATNTGQTSISYGWSTAKASKGSHTITVIARGADGQSSQASVTVYK